jgi:hypothetical protein
MLRYLLIAFSVILTITAVVFGYPFQVVVPFIEALTLIAAIFIYGFFLLQAMGVEKIKFDAAFASGMIFTVFFFYSASFLKILTAPVLLFFYLFPLPLLFLIIRKHKTSLAATVGSFLKRPAFEYLLFLFPLVYASLPPSFYDTLVFHLGIPNLYLQHAGFIATPHFLYGNFSIYYEISLIPAVFAGDLVPSFFHFFIGVILIFSLIDFGVEFFNIKKRNIFALTLISIPLSVFLLSTVKNDLPSAFFIFLAIKYFLNNRTFFAALMWGFAIGIKYTNIVPLLIFFPLMAIKEKSFDVKNYIFTGNPFYPFFYEHFKTGTWDAGRQAEMEKDSGGIIDSFGDFLKFPYTLSFGEVGIGGIPGPIFLIFLPFLLLRKEKDHFPLIFSLLLLFIGPLFKASIRCWYIAFLLLAIYVVRVYEAETKKIMRYIFFVVIALNFLTAFAFQERAYKSHYLLSGKFTPEEYKALLFPTYPAFAYLNRNVPKRSQTLIIGEARNYYLKRPYHAASPYDYPVLKSYLNANRTVEQCIASLKKDGIGYIVYNEKEFARLQDNYKQMSVLELSKFNDFIHRLRPLFNRQGVYVFGID